MADEPTPPLPDPSRPRLPQRSSPRAEQRNVGTFFALFAIGLLAFGFIGMVALVLPQVRGLVLVFFGAVAFFAAHYLLWGWWLPKLTHKDDEPE